ncbi:MAG: sodium:calcium antiporter [Aquificae bacterium]|nr:sodium:calcium antiporter [Aquificota bacterium]
MIFDIALFIIGLFLILVAAELFTNGIEYLGHRLQVSQGFTGSVLAAVGTALPETILPIIAILFFADNAGHEIGVGAILGAPFMLSTLAFPLIGITALIAYLLKRRELGLNIEADTLRRDTIFFLFAYSIALFIVPYENHTLRIFTAIFLVILYIIYVIITLKSESSEMEEVEHLYFLPKSQNPPTFLIIFQVIVALSIMIFGAHLFVHGLETLSHLVGISPLIFSLLIAPVATELPEKINSVIWIWKNKDVLAIGNVSGAMVFQSTIPVSFGIIFTQWDITGLAFVSGVFAIVASFIALTSSFITKKLVPFGFTIGIIFYIVYIYLVIKQF